MAYGDAEVIYHGESYTVQRSFAHTTASGVASLVASATGKIRVLQYLINAGSSNTFTWMEGATGAASGIEPPIYIGSNGVVAEDAPHRGFVFETGRGEGLRYATSSTGFTAVRATWCRIGSTT